MALAPDNEPGFLAMKAAVSELAQSLVLEASVSWLKARHPETEKRLRIPRTLVLNDKW